MLGTAVASLLQLVAAKSVAEEALVGAGALLLEQLVEHELGLAERV